MPGGGARGKNLKQLRSFCLLFFLVWNYMYLYLNNRYFLGLTLSVISNLRI